MSSSAERSDLLAARATDWIRLAEHNIRREYPHMAWIYAESADDYGLHRETHPAFYGSFDWHSCVEMFWVATRLMRLVPGTNAEASMRATINDHITAETIAAETRFVVDRPSFERPYGWGWLLALWHHMDVWDDPDAARWHTTLTPLANAIMDNFAAWLPKLTYPHRIGMHSNTAFGMWLAWDAVEAHRPALLDLFRSRALSWFHGDEDYPVHYEPSGADFLSAGLCEAVLMTRVLPATDVPDWLARFLPGIASSQPDSLFLPATISDPTDGHIAHLHGLNLSRAWAFLTLANALSDGDDRVKRLLAAADRHADASLEAVSGSHYMVEHWLSAYATLFLTT